MMRSARDERIQGRALELAWERYDESVDEILAAADGDLRTLAARSRSRQARSIGRHT